MRANLRVLGQHGRASVKKSKDKAPELLEAPSTIPSTNSHDDDPSTGKEVERLYCSGQLPKLLLSYYPLHPVDKEWWGILLGHEQSGNFINSHIDAWVNVVLESRSSVATWWMMNSQFAKFILTHGVSYVESMCDGTQPEHPG